MASIFRIFRWKLTKKLILSYLTIIAILFIFIRAFSFLASKPEEDFNPHLNLDDVNLLLQLSSFNGISLYLFDAVILQAWNENRIQSDGMCLFLCHVIGPLAFAVTDSQLKDKVDMFIIPRY